MATAKKNSSTRKVPGFSAEERAAMKERASETRPASKPGDGEQAVLAKIAAMQDSDRQLAEQLHALIRTVATSLQPQTWYGMPAYAQDGKVLCFFQDAKKFKTRYATLGFSDKARLDDGGMWPTGFAILKLGAAEKEEIGSLLQRALGNG
jgi:uncharacterized protein YdhG (YjbR/CyaY superfamily)